MGTLSNVDFDMDPYRSFGGSVARLVRSGLEPRRDEMAALLAGLVRIESATDDPGGLERLARRLVELFGEFGTVESHPIGPGGARHLAVTVPGRHDTLPHLALLGHYDTVWPRGTIERLPCRVSGDVLSGPGCFDMKGGLVLLWYALRELFRIGDGPRRTTRILLNCDEEVRSRTSRGLIAELASGAAAALVLESPLPGGGLKSGRKGTGIYRLEVEGRAAHAGIEPGKGASAIVELAHQVRFLDGLNDPAEGTTVNVGVVGGGTRPNVVAAAAHAEIDVRITTRAAARRIERVLGDLAPVLSGTRVRVIADLPRPPMEPTPESRRLFGRARAIALAMGVTDLFEGSTGGASDANLMAAAGVPTLDGFGPEGGGAHADDEHVLIGSMPRRAALLAGLLAEV